MSVQIYCTLNWQKTNELVTGAAQKLHYNMLVMTTTVRLAYMCLRLIYSTMIHFGMANNVNT